MYKRATILLNFCQEHLNLTKAEKKELCRILDCQKLSPQVRSHAVKNERLPLRTVVQVLFFDQEGGGGGSRVTSQILPQEEQHIPHTTLDDLTTSKPTPTSKLVKQPTKTEGLLRRSTTPGGEKEAVHPRLRKSADVKLQDTPKSGMPKTKGEGEGRRDSEKGKAIREDRIAAGNKLYPMKIPQKKVAESQQSHSRSREG